MTISRRTGCATGYDRNPADLLVCSGCKATHPIPVTVIVPLNRVGHTCPDVWQLPPAPEVTLSREAHRPRPQLQEVAP